MTDTTADPIDMLGRYMTARIDSVADSLIASYGDRYTTVIVLYPINGQMQRHFYRFWTATCTEIVAAYRSTAEYSHLDAETQTCIDNWLASATDTATLSGMFPHLPIEHSDGRHVDFDDLVRIIQQRLCVLPGWDLLPPSFQRSVSANVLGGIAFHLVEHLGLLKEAEHFLFSSRLLGWEKADTVTDDDLTMLWEQLKAAMRELDDVWRYRTESIGDHSTTAYNGGQFDA